MKQKKMGKIALHVVRGIFRGECLGSDIEFLKIAEGLGVSKEDALEFVASLAEEEFQAEKVVSFRLVK